MPSVYVEVDLSEFDDDYVLKYARGLAGFESEDADTVRDLSMAIEAGDKFTAHAMLDRLIRDSASLRQAADVGRCQRNRLQGVVL